jgi:hypothetical protein
MNQGSLFDAPPEEPEHTNLQVTIGTKSRIELIAATNSILLNAGHHKLAQTFVLATKNLKGNELLRHIRKYVHTKENP